MATKYLVGLGATVELLNGLTKHMHKGSGWLKER
jgi:hypothetical protein